MQNTSELHNELLARNPTVEKTIAVGEGGKLIDKSGNGITFGGVTILVDSGGPESGYDDSMIISMSTDAQAFPDDSPVIGTAQIGMIEVDMFSPIAKMPRAGRLCPYARLKDGNDHSEWIQQGVYYIDERESTDEDGIKRTSLTGYDAMRYAEQPYPNSHIDWPALDVSVVQEIADTIGVQVDQRTWDTMTNKFSIPYPANYSCRETLGHIAAMYVGNFVISSTGELLLVPLFGLPKETRVLVDKERNAITFGGVRINV